MTIIWLLLSAYVASILASAPIGPVNMVAIRRGLIFGWTRSLSVGLGSVVVETGYVALSFWGGTHLIERLPVDSIRLYLGVPAAAILLLIAAVMLRRAIVNPQRVLAAVRLERMRQRQTGVLRNLLTGGALTAINPGTIGYWLSVGPQLLQKADVATHSPVVWYALIAASCGGTSWFLFVSLLVRLRPQRVGPNFFRAVNGVCGGLLTILGVALAVQALA